MKNGFVASVLVAVTLIATALAQGEKAPATTISDQTQARLRVAHLVRGGPEVDLLIDGSVAFNMDVGQAGLPAGYIGGYLYIEPGRHEIAVVPTGRSIDAALVGPLDLGLEAGHRYTVAVLGQLEDPSLTPLVMDDTETLREARTSPEQGIMILINNLADTTTLDFTLGGEGPIGVPYLGFAAAPMALSVGAPLRIATDLGVIAQEPGPGMDPAVEFLVAFYGRTAGDDFADTQSENTSDLDIVSFLRQFSGRGFEWAGHPISFERFLEALDVTGMDELLSSGRTYLVFPPTDEAFAQLPAENLAELMGDADALTQLLRYHIVEGYFPKRTLTGEEYWVGLHTNLAGTELQVTPTSVAGKPTADLQDYMVANGSRVAPITTVLLPATR